MVVTIPRIDIGGEIGRGLGQAGAGIAENIYLTRQLEGLEDKMRKSPNRTPIDLYAMLNSRLGATPRGRALAQQLLPELIQSARQMPVLDDKQAGYPAQEQPVGRGFQGAAAPTVDTGFRGGAASPAIAPSPETPSLAAPIMRAAGLPNYTANPRVKEVAAADTKPKPQNILPPVEGPYTGESKPETKAVRPSGDDLIWNPERVQDMDREALRAYYSAPPVLDPTRAAQEIQSLMQSGRARDFNEAQRMVQDRFNRELGLFNQKREQFERQEARIGDAMQDFSKQLKRVVPDPDADMENMGRRIVQWYAIQENPDGSPQYIPRIAAELAMRDVDQINKTIATAVAKGPRGYLEGFNPEAKAKRVEDVRPIIRLANKFGVQNYVRNKLVASEIFSPADASAMFFPPSESLLDRIEKVPKIGYDWWERLRDPREPPSEKVLEQAHRQATDILKSLGSKDSLVVARALFNDRGFTEKQFNDAYDQALSEGWEPSEFQDREYITHLTIPVKYSFFDLWGGYARNFKEWVINVFGPEKN